MRRAVTGFFVAALLASTTAFAQVGEGVPGDRPDHRGPPEEAIAACEGMVSGDACTVEIPSRVMEGTCEAMPWSEDSDELACRPEPVDLPSPDANEES
jgi:hypothetical protein